MLEGPIAILALCGPAIHQLTSRAINYGSITSLFTSRRRGTGPKSGGSSSGTPHKAGFSGLDDSQPARTWPLVTFTSTSSTTAIAEGYKDGDDWQNQPDLPAAPMAYGYHGRREQHIV
jgi:hypothetical protein